MLNVKFTEDEAQYYRELINNLADSMTDEEALTAQKLFDVWEPGIEYHMGHKVRYNGILYKVLINHVSQEDWTPAISPSLFAKVLIPDPEIIPEWEQPGSTNPYMKGDKVRHFDKIWESLIDYNVFEPGTVGTETLWTEIFE